MNSIITRVTLLLVACACGVALGQVTFNGPCPKVPVVENFSVPEYMGLWYEVAKYPAPFELGGKCITAEYGLLENGTVSVVNSQYNVYAQRQISIQGSAVAVENAKLMVQFPRQPAPTGSNYWVLDTDYKNYSVVFSCSEAADDTHREIIWILSRERVPSTESVIKALVVLTSNNLSLNHLTITDQNGC